jgi:hypothetical protein
MATPGTRFAQSLAAKDESSLRGLLAPDVDFRALTPGRPWEAADADGVLRAVFGFWFEPSDEILGVLEVRDGEDVADTHAVRYRFRVRNRGGTYLVEQQAYYRCDVDGRIDHLRVLCSGYRPVE